MMLFFKMLSAVRLCSIFFVANRLTIFSLDYAHQKSATEIFFDSDFDVLSEEKPDWRLATTGGSVPDRQTMFLYGNIQCDDSEYLRVNGITRYIDLETEHCTGIFEIYT